VAKPKNTANREPVSAYEKIARLLGMLAIRNVEALTERVTLLRSAGFQVSEVAEMLGIEENHVRVATHHGRKKKPKKSKKSR
jgi:DNA-directed RNA polymerase specialized sigma24 family protein